MSYTRTPRLEAAARECAGLNEQTYRMIPDWEQELWCSRAWAAITTWAEHEPTATGLKLPFKPCDTCTAECTGHDQTSSHYDAETQRCNARNHVGNRCKRTDPHDDRSHQAKGYTWQGTYTLK